MSASAGRAAPRRTTTATAVPSSSRKPSLVSAATRPPTRTVCPTCSSIATRSMSVAAAPPPVPAAAAAAAAVEAAASEPLRGPGGRSRCPDRRPARRASRPGPSAARPRIGDPRRTGTAGGRCRPPSRFGPRRSRCSGWTLRRDRGSGPASRRRAAPPASDRPERWTSTTSPRTRTSRHSWAALGATRRSSALTDGRRRAGGPGRPGSAARRTPGRSRR